ncbi:MAG TPA: DUF167 family protein [Candidatus Acidoferrales bacterium]|jgi:uncharacterized protein (TIGR00251 family)|nr:DUF167 family protein [Candidatus Acidoferrales bacterium]
MRLVGALKAVPEGVKIRVEVKAGSRNVGVEGYNAWRQTVIIRVTERTQFGKANIQLIRYLAQLFERQAKGVVLVSGHTSTRKVVLLSSVLFEEVESIIAKEIADGVAR